MLDVIVWTTNFCAVNVPATVKISANDDVAATKAYDDVVATKAYEALTAFNT